MNQPHTFGIELSPEQAADYLGITKNQLHLLRVQGKVTYYKFSGHRKLLQSELDLLGIK